MNGGATREEVFREGIRADLTEAALDVTSRHGVRGGSVDQEVALWNALGEVVHKPGGQGAGSDGRERKENLVAEATEAAYGVALHHGFRGSFLDLRLDLWKSLCLAVRRSRFARGLFPFLGAVPGMGERASSSPQQAYPVLA